MHHRDGGRDPTELPHTAQPVLHRPTGACHTPADYPSQPVMGGDPSSHFTALEGVHLCASAIGHRRVEHVTRRWFAVPARWQPV